MSELSKAFSVWLSLSCALMLVSCGGGGSEDVTLPVLPEADETIVPPEPDPADDPVPVSQGELAIIPTDQVRPLRPGAPYANVLKTCALADADSLCTLSTLPYIGHETASPAIEDILNRTLVTHDWMGDRLEQLLQTLPKDMLQLFRSVTSILIGSEVRPSSYSSYRGSIKIDAQHLWLSVEEKRTISTEEDFRTNYGADLQFIGRWRSMLGDEYAIPYFSLVDSSERQIEDILILAARPLYHELAHANDYIRPDNITALSLDLTPREAVAQSKTSRLSYRLYEDPSLTDLDSVLYGLARVRWYDDPPTDFQKSVLADYVGSVMSTEGKSRFYGYLTNREDVAVLFDQFMLKYHFGVDIHVGFVNKPENYPDDYTCDELIVSWGTRNRLANPLVSNRAKWVVEQLIGSSAELDEFFANSLGEDTPLREGDDWCASRYANPVAANREASGVVSDAEILRRENLLFTDH